MAEDRDQIRDFMVHVAPRVTQPVVFDVGTNRGQILDQMIAALPGGSFHAFEPNPVLAKELHTKYGGRENVHVEGVGVGSCEGTLRFNVNRYDETSSFLPTSEHFQKLKWADTLQQIEVPVLRLDKYCQRQGISEVHLIKIDTQGFELEVLTGAKKMLPGVWAVYAEVLFSPMYKGQGEFWELDRYMRKQNFRLLNLYHLSTQEETGQLGAADAMWVNNAKSTYYRARQPWETQLEKQLGMK